MLAAWVYVADVSRSSAVLGWLFILAAWIIRVGFVGFEAVAYLRVFRTVDIEQHPRSASTLSFRKPLWQLTPSVDTEYPALRDYFARYGRTFFKLLSMLGC